MGSRGIADLHCHLLPGIDDGAETLEIALEVLKKMEKSGVDAVALTPHFRCGRQTPEEFFAKRQQAYRLLCTGLAASGCSIRFKLGAEVFFSPELIGLDFKQFCMEGTPYLLVEFPVTHYPAWAKEVFYQLQLAGVIPVLAHAERYPYFIKNPVLLYDLVNAGVLVQINANSLQKKGAKQKMALKWMGWDMVHLLASDVHSLTKRPFGLDKTLKLLQNGKRKKKVGMFLSNAEDIFEGKALVLTPPQRPRNFLNFWI